MRDNRILIFDPKPNASPDDVMEVLKLFTFQTYPEKLKTRENMMVIFDQLSPSAKRHFEVKHREADEL